MHIEGINWLDIGGEEAVLKVVGDEDCLICFACPCPYNVGDVLVEPLECLDTDNIIICETKDNNIEKIHNFLPLNFHRSFTYHFIFSIHTSIFNYLCLKLTNSYYFRTMFMPELKLRIYV